MRAVHPPLLVAANATPVPGGSGPAGSQISVTFRPDLGWWAAYWMDDGSILPGAGFIGQCVGVGGETITCSIPPNAPPGTHLITVQSNYHDEDYILSFIVTPGGLPTATATPTSGPSATSTPPGPTPAGSWSTAMGMNTRRVGHTATLLLDGRVLVAGGGNASAELYDAHTGRWTATGSMSVARSGAMATLLPDGRVLVAGGDSSGASAELYDPTTGTWSVTGAMTVGRSGATATLLPDGRVLVIGGDLSGASSTAELYDPRTGRWTPTGTLLTPRQPPFTATLLPDGQVLVAGGYDLIGRVGITDAELYNPATGAWTATGSMTTPRDGHTATLLPDGHVLVAGGETERDGGVSSPPDCCITASAELYDPQSGTWTATGTMTASRGDHTATLLPNGQVLAAGGLDHYESTQFSAQSAELYDPQSGTWTATGSMTTPRYDQSATLLPDGQVLVAGGCCDSAWNALSSTEVYLAGSQVPTPLPTPTSTATPPTPTPIPTFPPGSASWYVLAWGSDANDCRSGATPCRTIGHALSLAQPGDTISIAAGTYDEHLAISQDVTLLGAGAGQTIIDGQHLSGPGVGSVVQVTAGTVTIAGVTIQNGYEHGASCPGGGLSNSGTLTLRDSTISGNADGNQGGGVANCGTMTIANSTITNNQATMSGGGVANTGALTITGSTIGGNQSQTGAGGVVTTGVLTVTQSTISGNSGGGQGGLTNGGTTTITASTISGNQGAGIENRAGALWLVNATVADNNADWEKKAGLVVDGGTVTVLNSTISNNIGPHYTTQVQESGGIANYGGTVQVGNSIVYGNTSFDGSPLDCSGTLTSLGYNVVGVLLDTVELYPGPPCGGVTAGMNGDQVGVDPQLGPLQDNGGPTLTMALSAGSPAIDAGNPEGCRDATGQLLTTDQRGAPRPYPAGGRCDSGAYEYGTTVPATPTATVSAPAPPSPTMPASVTPITPPSATPSATATQVPSSITLAATVTPTPVVDVGTPPAVPPTSAASPRVQPLGAQMPAASATPQPPPTAPASSTPPRVSAAGPSATPATGPPTAGDSARPTPRAATTSVAGSGPPVPSTSRTARPHPPMLPLLVRLGQRAVASGGTLRLRLQTRPRALVTIGLQAVRQARGPQRTGHRHMPRPHLVVLYTVRETGHADAHGVFVTRLHITYRVSKPQAAHLTVGARLGRRAQTRTMWVVIDPSPTRHAARRPHRPRG